MLEPASAAVPRTYCQFGPLHTTADAAVHRAGPAGVAVVALAVAARRASRCSSRSSRSRAAWSGSGAPCSRRSCSRCRRCTSRRPRPPPARRCTCCCGWRLERLLAALAKVGRLLDVRAGRAARVARRGHPLRRVAGAAVDGRGRRLADAGNGCGTPDSNLCRPDRCSRCARRCCRSRGWSWGRAPAATRCFSRTTSWPTTPAWPPSAGARYGAVLGRVRQLGIWALAFVAAMTLPGAMLAVVGFRRGWRALSPAMRARDRRGAGPPALYLVQGLCSELRAAGAIRAGAGDVAAAAGGRDLSRSSAGASSSPRPPSLSAVLLDRHLAGRHRGAGADLGGRRVDGGPDPPRSRGPRAGRVSARAPPARINRS